MQDHFKKIYRAAKKHHGTVVKTFKAQHRQAYRLFKTYGFDLNDLRHHAVRTMSLAGIAATALVGPAYAHNLQVANAAQAPSVLTTSVPLPDLVTNQILQKTPMPPLQNSMTAVGPNASLASPLPPPVITYDQSSLQQLASGIAGNAFGKDEVVYFNRLITMESSWNPTAKQRNSGAYGLGQALPASKMAPFGNDYLTNPTTQLNWMVSYIQSRYGTPKKAYYFHLSHGWY